MSSEQKGTNLTTTALYVGVPILIGASCYYLYSANKRKDANSDPSSSSESKLRVKQLSPKEHLAHLKELGNNNFTRKNYDVAIEHYTKAIEFSSTLGENGDIKPDELAVFYQNRAACNFELDDLENVISDCNRAIELKSNYVKAYVKRAKAYEKMAQYDKAMVDAFSANLLDKFQSQTIMSLAESIVKSSSKIKALEAMKNYKPTWASPQTIKNYFQAFVCDPIKEKLEGINPTVESLQTLLDEANKPENDDDPFSLLVRGTCASLRGDSKLADETLKKLVAMDQDKVSPRLRANALIKIAALMLNEQSSDSSANEKDLERMLEVIDQGIEVDPENPDLHLHRSQTLVLLERLEESIVSLDKAIELKEDFHQAIAQKFYIEFKLLSRNPGGSMSKGAELVDKLKEAVKQNPESQAILEMHAQVLTELMNFEGADQALQEISQLDPNNGNIYVSRALLQFHTKNDSDEVTNLLKEAIRIDPTIIFAYEILGSIETQRGKTEEAIKIFETALQYAKNQPEFERGFGLLDSAISQRVAAKNLGMQI